MALNMFELVRGFWRQAEVERFSPTATALYFYLLNKANVQKWQMPIRCPTETIRVYIDTTKPSIMHARDELKRRGLIDFTPGTGKGNYPLYTLISPSENDSQETARNTYINPRDFTHGFTVKFTDNLPLYKNKESKTNNDDNARTSKEYLKDLFSHLSDNESWLSSICSLMHSQGHTDVDIKAVKRKMNEFLLYLIASGNEMREEKELRRYFINWLAKNIQQKKYNNNEHSTINEDRRRADKGNAASASSYDDPF